LARKSCVKALAMVIFFLFRMKIYFYSLPNESDASVPFGAMLYNLLIGCAEKIVWEFVVVVLGT
jgi:hypothetical protein